MINSRFNKKLLILFDDFEVDNKDIKLLIDLYHESIKEASSFVEESVLTVLSSQINLSEKESAIYGTFLRLHSLFSPLKRLNHYSDFNTVAITARTIFGLFLDLRILSDNDIAGKEIEKFTKFPRVIRFRNALKIREFEEKSQNLIIKPLFNVNQRRSYVEETRSSGEIETLVDHLWGRNKRNRLNWPEHWTGKNVRERTQMFGEETEYEYVEVYSWLSEYVHSGSSSYFGHSKEALGSIYGIALEYCREKYIEALIIVCKVFHLNAVFRDFKQVVDFLKNAPKYILIELKSDAPKH